jgi:hypothetical protein
MSRILVFYRHVIRRLNLFRMYSLVVLNQVVFSPKPVSVPFALSKGTEEPRRMVSLAPVALKATLIGEPFLFACGDGTYKGSVVPIFMTSEDLISNVLQRWNEEFLLEF